MFSIRKQILETPGTTTAALRRVNLNAVGKVAVVEENRVHSDWVKETRRWQASHGFIHQETISPKNGVILVPLEPRLAYLTKVRLGRVHDPTQPTDPQVAS